MNSRTFNLQRIAIANLSKNLLDDGMIIPAGQTVYVLFNETANDEGDLPGTIENDYMRCVTTIAIDHRGVFSGWVVGIRLCDLKFIGTSKINDLNDSIANIIEREMAEVKR